MKVFANYARYYNLLYRDKDYATEANFVNQLLQSYAPGTESIIELGCGTGAHAALLAQAGYEVYGVDLSADMLEQAQTRSLTLPPALACQLNFSQGDIRNVRLERKFDAAISLFHVFSYQTSNDDLQAAFATAKYHLKPGGVFIFDCWYGPAVLSDRPTVRVKRLEDEEIIVTRIAEPIMDFNDNLVDVNYQVFIQSKDSGTVEQIHETHKMRYLFKPEIDLLLKENALELITYGEWMTGKKAGANTWQVFFVTRG